MSTIFSATSTPVEQNKRVFREIPNERMIITMQATQERTDLSRGLVHYDGAALSKALTSKPKHRTDRVSREIHPARTSRKLREINRAMHNTRVSLHLAKISRWHRGNTKGTLARLNVRCLAKDTRHKRLLRRSIFTRHTHSTKFSRFRYG